MASMIGEGYGGSGRATSDLYDQYMGDDQNLYDSLWDTGNFDNLDQSPIGLSNGYDNSAWNYNQDEEKNKGGIWGNYSFSGTPSNETAQGYRTSTLGLQGYAPAQSYKQTGMFGETMQNLANNPIVSTLMSLNPITAGLNALAKGPSSSGGFLGSMIGSKLGPLGSMFGSAAGQGAGKALDQGYSGSFTDYLPSASRAGGLLGAFAGGSMFGSDLGALGGSKLGSYLGNLFSTGESSGMPTVNKSIGDGSTMNINDSVWGAIPSLYAALKQNNESSNQINNLQSLYSNNSAYSQELRKQLERRDAAAGRRSQYGGREVELQAKLAALNAQMAPTLNNLYNQRSSNRNLLLQTLLRNKGVQGLAGDAWSGLQGLFSQPQQASSLPEFSFGNFDYSTLPNGLLNSAGSIDPNGGGGW